MSINQKLRLGLILNREFHEQNRWVSALTPRLVELLLQRFDCLWIEDQKDYENTLGSVDALLSMEPGWAAPRLNFVRSPVLKEILACTPSYIFYSDPHANQWREDYFLQNGLDFILAYFYSPTRYHFRRVPADSILSFPWSIPDDWVSTEPITCRKQSRIALFGASQHEAYDVRNWCRTFPFVESLTNSGVENKVMPDQEYMKWLRTWDAAIAAGSDDPRYRLTTPKYFEIPAAGSLLFAQETDDLKRLGFRHMENCVLFNRTNFVQLAQQYLTKPEDHIAIRKAGRELIRHRHRMSTRLDFLEDHIRQRLASNLHRRNTFFREKKKVTKSAPQADGGSSVPKSAQLQQATTFLSPEDVYLASADRMDRVLSNVEELKSLQIKQVDTYASVIGGLSGLNYLLAFDPQTIVFFDINPGMVAYARLIKAMVGIARTPEEFISRIFCRSVEAYLARTGEKKLTCENQDGFLAMTVDETILSDTIDQLSSEERSTFEAFVAPHLPARVLDGARNCRRLLPCWPVDERVPVGAGEALGTDESGALVPNTNTFFCGHGWLASREDYRKVRQALQDKPVHFMSFDLLRDDWQLLSSLRERFLLHISNVDDWFPHAWKERVQALDRRVVKAQGLCWVVTSHNGIRRPAADPHAYAYAALAPYVYGEVVEVTRKVPWGFHEFDRVNVTIDDYLRRDYRSDTTILHILVGEGMSRDRFEHVLRKAAEHSERVIILEHNAASSDWTAEQSKSFFHEEHLHELVNQYLQGSSFKLFRTLHLAGKSDLRRNLLVILDRDTAETGKVDRPAGQADGIAISPRNGSPVRKARPHILLIADVPNWIFARHCRMLQRYLDDEFDFTIKFQGEPFREDEFDLIYPLEWNLVEPGHIGNPKKYVTGIRSHVWWPDLNFTEFTGFLASTYQRVHVVSKRLYDIFMPALPGAVYISHGVDTEFFMPSARTDQSGNKLRLGWAGNRQQPAKRFKEFIEPLGKIPGVELVFCGYADRNLTLEEMLFFYDSLDAYICASDNEGNNNSLMEAASMKRAIITTDSGTVPEYLIDGKNALIVPCKREAFVQAVEKLRDDPALRMKLGKAARRAVTSAWDWRDRSEDYRHFFREALQSAQTAAPQPIAQPAPVKRARAIQGVSQKETPECAYEIIRKVIQAGMYPEAKMALQELIQSHPGFSSAYHDLGVLYHNSNEKEKALANYEKAVSLDPEKAEFLQSLADFYFVEQNRAEDALRIYLGILKIDPSNIEVLSITGNLLAVTGNPDAARGYYLRILEMEPGNQNARENLEFLARIERGDDRLRNSETVRKQGAPTSDFKVIAIISAHNEGDVINHVIGDLIRQGVSAYLLDHRSTDNTAEEAAKWLGKGLLHIEKFPDDSHYAEENKSQYIWRDILKRKSEIASQLDADWFIHADADEFRESPWPSLTLKEAIQVVDRLGYNAIDFELLNFRPVDNSFVPGKDVREFLKYYEGAEDYNSRQVKAWKNYHLPIDLVTSGGHDVAFDGRTVFPIRFILRHYPIRSQQHGLLKVFKQRKSRFCATERAMAWHVQYDHIQDEKHNFLHNPEQLFYFDGDNIRKRLLAGSPATSISLDAAPKTKRAQESETHENICRVLIKGGRRSEAVLALEKLVETHPDYAPAYDNLGRIYHESGNGEKALVFFEKAVSLDPLNAGFIRHLADFLYVELKNTEEAFLLYEKILCIIPEDVDTLCVMGNLSIERQDFDKARTYYLKALQIDPTNETAGTMLDALESKGLRSTAEVNPDTALFEARWLAKKGETHGAIIKLETLLQHYPDEARAYNDLGILYCLQKDNEKAIFHLDRAVQLKPDELRFVNDLADAYLAEAGNVEEALKLYNHALALKPDDVDTLLRIGNLCAVQKQYDDAQFFYSRVQSIEPENAQARENLAVLQSMSENAPSQDDPAAGDRDARLLFDEERRAANGAMPSTASRQSASIIIPVFNQVEFTARCLEALYRNTPLDAIHEVLIVDNGSSDGTGTFLEETLRRYPKLRVLTNRENLLFAKACNQAADVAGGNFLVFLNNDTEPLPGWLGYAIERLESDDSIGVVGIKLLYPDGTVQHCGIQFQRDAHPSYVIWPLHRHLRASANDPRVNEPEDVHAVTGACLFIRRELFRRIGGFEERYGMYFEDTDLCFKARRAGKRVFYEPASVVIHHEGKSSPSRNVIDDLNTRAASLFFKTWKEDLCRIEIETLIEKEDGRYAYFPRDFWPGEVSPEEIVRMHRLLTSFPSCYIHFGGSGDALLLLSTFYDRNPEQTIVSVANSTGMMKSFFDAFPKLKKVYFVPFPKNSTWHFIARRFFKASDICLGLGATPTTTADYREWNADLDIFKTYGIQQRPAWASDFGKNRMEPRQVTLQPRGSLRGMVGSKRNALSTDNWVHLLTYLEKKGVKPIVIGTPDEAAEYPCLGNAIDKRSYSFAEQMQLIAASDFFVGADSWGKTFSALAGIRTFVFHALRGDDLKNWKDASDYVFLDPWDEITVVKDFKAFRKSFDDAWRDRFPSATDLKIRWEGSQFVHHSLALVNRELCLRLIEEGCEVSIIPYERDQFTPKEEPRFKPIAERTRKPLCGPADVHVRHQWPPNFIPPPEGHWVIIQPWEFGSIPREWVRHMSASVDEAWVPSNYVRDCYIKSGVPSERVFVVPNGVNISLFNPDNAPYPLKTKKAFKFLFVGGTIQRKGIDILLEVYTKTFSSHDDVCLVIKDMGGQTFYKGQTAKHWICQSQADPRSPEIEYIEQSLGDRQIAGLYTACNCLVHPYRGEGFGLPIAEAMASGLPVIVTGRGAALDFCDDKTAYLIPATEVRLQEKRIGEYETIDFPWLAEPDKDGLARLMRHVVSNPQEAREKGIVASRHICSRFTWDRAADAVVRRVRELRKKPVMREVQNRPDMKPGEKPEATQHRDRKILDDARRYCQRGDLTAAVARYGDAMKKYPGDLAIFHELTEHLIATKHYKDALDILEKIPSGENDQMRIVLVGYCREGLDEDEEAGRLADRALQMDEHSARAVNLKGILACKRGDRREAEKLFRRAAEADPSWGEPYTNLGVLAWAEGEREAALDLLEKGFILTPHVEDIANRYHEAAVSLGALVRAEAVYREARSLYPSSRTIAFLLIDLLISQENYRTAMAEIESAMAAFDVDDGFIAVALEVRGRVGTLEIQNKGGGKALSLCMIVRNEQPNLVRCLSSIKNVVDEIIVVDTGSEDHTKEIASIFGAKVFDAPWNDDFADARNTALSKATGDWIFVLDADETLSPRDHGRLREFMQKVPGGADGYDLTTRNYVLEANTSGWTANDGSYADEEAGTGWYPNRKVRLFRNDPRIRFSGAVHELVEPSMQKAGMKIAACDVPVHHTGKLERESVLEKGERYYRLGLKKVEESGGTPRAFLELAIQAGELGRYDDAIMLWRRYLDGEPAQDVDRATVNLIHACLNANRFDEALSEARKAAGRSTLSRELRLNCAAAEFFAGDLRKATRMAEKLLKKDPEYPPALVLLAASRALAGQHVKSAESLRRLHERGLEPHAQIRPVIEKLRKAGKPTEAEQLRGFLNRQSPAEFRPVPSPSGHEPARDRQFLAAMDAGRAMKP